jgi:mannose-6-phosphate isomerase-like protein (cupin superfamily)
MIFKNVASLAAFRPDKMGKADLLRTERLFTGLNCFEPGQEHALHTHAGQDKLYYVVEGQGIVRVGDVETSISAGDLVLARADEPHALRNPGSERLIVMAIMAPPPEAK